MAAGVLTRTRDRTPGNGSLRCLFRRVHVCIHSPVRLLGLRHPRAPRSSRYTYLLRHAAWPAALAFSRARLAGVQKAENEPEVHGPASVARARDFDDKVWPRLPVVVIVRGRG